jgi:hypothetical protein
MYRILHGRSNRPPKREGSIGSVALRGAIEVLSTTPFRVFAFSVCLASVYLRLLCFFSAQPVLLGIQQLLASILPRHGRYQSGREGSGHRRRRWL